MITPYLIINTYVSLMYELKKNGKVFTNKFVGTGRGPILKKKKKNLPCRGLTKFEKHFSRRKTEVMVQNHIRSPLSLPQMSAICLGSSPEFRGGGGGTFHLFLMLKLQIRF
jgi:hypothetical protein